MNARIDLMNRLVGAFEEHSAAWNQDHSEAMECLDVEEIIALGMHISTVLRDTYASIRQVSSKVAEAGDFEDVILKKEEALLNKRFCNSFKQYEQAIASLRAKGFDVKGSEQFIGCIRDAERHFARWQDEQEKAMKLRAAWMRAAGLGEEEIAEHCNPENYPADLQEEEQNVRAQNNVSPLRSTNNELVNGAGGTQRYLDLSGDVQE